MRLDAVSARQALSELVVALAVKSTIAPDVARTAAPSFFRLARAGLVQSLVGSEVDLRDLTDLLTRFAEVTAASGAPEISRLADWWMLAYCGQPIDGGFFTNRDLMPDLAAGLNRELKSPRRLAGFAVRREHERRMAALRALADDVTPTSRELFEALILSGIREIQQRLSADPNSDLFDIIGDSPEHLVEKADPDRTVPRNGLRWPGLVARARELQEHARALMATSRALADLPDTVKPGDSPAGDTDLWAALTEDPPGTDPLELVLSELPEEAGPPRLCLAALVDRLRIDAPGMSDEINSLRELAGPLVTEFAELLDLFEGQEEPVAVEARRCIEWGLLDDARVWLDELERASAFQLLTRRERILRSHVDEVPNTSRQRFVGILDALTTMIGQRNDIAASALADGADTLFEQLTGGSMAPAAKLPSASPSPATVGKPSAQAIVAPAPAQEVDADLLRGADEADRRRWMRALVSDANQSRLGEVARAFRGADDDWFWRMLVEETDPEHRPAWGALRSIFLDAVAACPKLDGLLVPPIPPMDSPLDGWTQEDRHLSVFIPKRTFTAASAAVTGPAVARIEEGDLAGAAREFITAGRGGWRVGFAHAIACLLELGEPGQALGAYAEYLRADGAWFVPANIAWNVGVAYEWLGDNSRAIASIRYFLLVVPNELAPGQALMVKAFGEAVGADFTTGSSDHRAFKAPVLMDGSSVLAAAADAAFEGHINKTQVEEMLAKEEYEAGQVREAEARLRRLLKETPRSPGSFLLLRIYRESKRWPDANAFMTELRRAGGATWRHELELARLAVEGGQPRASLQLLDRSAQMEPRAAQTVEFQRLKAQASESAAQEARSVATLGGKKVDSTVVSRLSSGGNLTREDWNRATRRTIQDGMLASVLDAAASVVGREPWVVASLVDTIIALDEALGNAQVRRRLITFVAQWDASSAEKLALYLDRISTEARGDAAQLRRDVCDLLTSARTVAEPALQLRLARLHIRTLNSLGRGEEAAELRRSVLPPMPDLAALDESEADTSLPPISPVFLRHTASRGMPDSFAAAIAVTRERDEETPVADLWMTSVEDGAMPALPNAIGWLILEDRTPDALRLYVKHADTVGYGAPLLWNVATALSRVGQYGPAVAWFDICARVTERDQPLAQLSARDALYRKLAITPPPRRGFSDDLPSDLVITEAQLKFGLRVLRDRVATGQTSADDAFHEGEMLRHRCTAKNDMSDAWAMFLFETGRSRESLDLLTAMAAQHPLSTVALHALLEVVRDLDEESRGLQILQAQPETPQLLMVVAKLQFTLGDLPAAVAVAQKAQVGNPTWHEPRWFLEAIAAGKSPMPSAKPPRSEVLHVGLTALGELELLIRVIPRPTLKDARLVIAGHQHLLGDLVARESIVLRLPRDRAYQRGYVTGIVDGAHRKLKFTVPKAIPPQRLVVRFDPTQPVTDSLFVGRRQEIEAIQDHYVSRRQILFLGGPRQVGKTSIIRRCVREHARDSRGLRFIMMQGDAFSAEQPFLVQLADAIRAQLVLQGRQAPRLQARDGLYADFMDWALHGLTEALGPDQLIVAIDEVQEMFDRLKSASAPEGALPQVAGLIRTINAEEDIPIKFLFLGSCTYKSVRDRLDGTNVQAEISEQLVGFLDRVSSAALVTGGFQMASGARGSAYVLEEAQDAFWKLTGGYPNHLHLLGAKVGDLLNERGERVVEASTVEQAADALVNQDRTVVEHLLGREREREYQQSVLSALAEFFGDEEADRPAPTRSDLLQAMGPQNAEGVDRFLRLGLLRSVQGTVRVANGLIRRWLVENSLRLELQRRELEQSDAFAIFHDAGLDIMNAQPDEFGERLTLRRGREFFLARRIPPSAANDLVQLGDLASDTPDASVSEVRDVLPPWVLMMHAQGRSLADASSNADKNWERDDTRRVVRTFRDAISVMLESNSVARWVHGNISPACIIERAGRSPFIANWQFGCSHERTLLTNFRASRLRPPEQFLRYEAGASFTPADDVFGIGASLFHVLDPRAEYPYPADDHGCAATGAVVAMLRQVGVDDDLERVISAAVCPVPEERPTLEQMRTAMSAWIERFG